jgi:uncharacterized membrane protein
MSVWTRVLLGVSLTLNLFVAGAVAGVLILRHRVLETAVDRDPVMAAADALAPAHRDAYRAMMRQTLLSVRPALRDARVARHAAMGQIAAEPIDRAGASGNLGRARADDAAARSQVEEAILEFAGRLPPAERAAYVQGLSRAALRRWLAAHPGGRPLAPQDP